MLNKIRYIIIVTICMVSALQAGYCDTTATEIVKYESKGKRDPFVPLIGQERGRATGLENVTSIQDINIEGIATGAGGKNVAILNGQMVKENDKFGILQIKQITRRSIIISIEGKDHTLNLQEEGNKIGK